MTEDSDDKIDIDLTGPADANWMAAGRELEEGQRRCGRCRSPIDEEEHKLYDGRCEICDRARGESEARGEGVVRLNTETETDPEAEDFKPDSYAELNVPTAEDARELRKLFEARHKHMDGHPYMNYEWNDEAPPTVQNFADRYRLYEELLSQLDGAEDSE